MDSSEVNYGCTTPIIRENHLVLKEEIKNLKRSNKVLRFHHFNKLCMDVETKIFDCDEEPKLSVLQNKVRKLDTGSDLCKEICLLQRHFSNLDLSNAVSEVLEKEKYEKISRKITLQKQMELKREKYFKNQAASIRKQCCEGKRLDVIPSVEEVAVPVPAEALQTSILEEDQNISDHFHKSILETGRIAARENGSLIDENITISNMPGARVTDLPSSLGEMTIPEIERRKVGPESEFNIDVSGMEHILQNGIADLGEIPVINDKTDIPELTNGDVGVVDLENLPPLSDTHARRKKRYVPVFDPSTTIPDYSKRARRLNASVSVERVQVYEGPPSILHAFTLEHVLETPAVNSGYYGVVRSSVILGLYSRHQKTEQTCHKELSDDFQGRRSVAPEMLHVEELVGQRQESRSEVQKSLLLDISAVQAEGAEMREASVAQSNVSEVQMARLASTPVSKILQEEIVASYAEVCVPCLPRLTRSKLRDKSTEEPTLDNVFKSTELSAPSEKWRKFKHVRKCLEEIWMEKEEKKVEKSASFREILEKENEWGKENMLTLLRIVDKMSLRREVVIKGRGVSVIIQPFEMPFVTEKQYSLQEHAPRF